jgi:PAS domain S-box-containing protein
MTSSLRILLLEDDSRDAGLIHGLLEADHLVCEIIRVETRAEFLTALEDDEIDLILADYQLPSFDGISALKLALSARPELSFIFVSGTLGEELAIEALKMGATDYVLKTSLSRLAPAVRRALREAQERAERKKAEEALRRNEAYLAEAQRLSRTGSFGWNASTGEIYWSDETYRIFGYETTTKPTVQMIVDRTHPDDRVHLQQTGERAAMEGGDFFAEHRLMMPDGSVKYVRAVARPSTGEDPRGLIYVGAVIDITERKRAEAERERLRQVEADLAHVNRLTTLGELTASLAHDLAQPIAATIMNASACLRWLMSNPPDLEEARQVAARIEKDGTRAAQIIERVRSFYRKDAPARREPVDVNEVAAEILVLLRNEADRNSVAMRTDFIDVPKVLGDRVQLQQVFMNLMLNGIEAMNEPAGELTVKSQLASDGKVLISVSDTGVGLPDGEADQLFKAFFTTKPHGTGMGLAICRSIIISHGGRLWAEGNTGRGATFFFTLPHETSASAA